MDHDEHDDIVLRNKRLRGQESTDRIRLTNSSSWDFMPLPVNHTLVMVNGVE